MNPVFNITRNSRKALLPFFENYTLEQLNFIPEKFSNNLIWNIGHIVVTQQMLVYKFSGLPMIVSERLVEKYRKGTRPEQKVTQEEVDEIKSLLFSTIDQTETDFGAKIFNNYQEFTTGIGYEIKTVQDAITFNSYHEALHMGVIMSIRKFI
jgi:DinB superfamily